MAFKGINVKGEADNFSRKKIDELTDYVKIYDAKGLAWLKVTEEGFTGPIAKFFSEEEKAILIERLEAETGDLLLFVADKKSIVHDALGPSSPFR